MAADITEVRPAGAQLAAAVPADPGTWGSPSW